ncbi:MAG: hypothetical protein HKP13_07075, partial [Gammaproteobacteria bacterium]|nr:hypothetical protein [Gammaproteobacteria bacterium]
LALTDMDDTNIADGTVSITAGFQSGTDVLSFIDQNGINGSYDAASGVLTLTGSASVTDYQTALASVSYHNSSAAPTDATRTVTFQVTDSNSDGIADGPLSDTATRNVTVTTINDAPIHTIPGIQTIDEDTSLTFSTGNGNLIAIDDVDIGSDSLAVTLTATNGTLTVSTISGLSFTAGDGADDATATFTGTLTAINTALDGMQFTPTSDYSGAASVQIQTDDQGYNGIGGPETDDDTVNITINSVPELITVQGFTAAYVFYGASSNSELGYSVDIAGDVNNDGFDDVIIGAHLDDTNGTSAGSATVFSGNDGALLYTFHGNSGDELGYSVSGAGDVNNDGFDDVIIGAPFDNPNGADSGSAYVYSGIDGALLHTFGGTDGSDKLGLSVDGAGDINNDGADDVIVSIHLDDPSGNNNAGRARVYSGADGSVLLSFQGSGNGNKLGRAVSDAGDVNNDGVDDVIVGIPDSDVNGNDSGKARVYSGADGSTLYTFEGDSANDKCGWSVSNAGDVNNDGYGDVIVSAYLDDVNGTNSGSAWIFSGIDGATIHTFHGDAADDELGGEGETGSVGDVDNDGYDDVIIGIHGADSNGTDAGSAWIVSGNTGERLYSFQGDSAGDMFGDAVGGAGDMNGDGLPDFIVGARFADNDGTDSGGAWLFHSQIATTTAGLSTISLKSGREFQGMLLDDAPAGSTFSYSIHTNPTHGTLTLTDNSFVYSNDGTFDDDLFQITITDDYGTSAVETIDVTVIGNYAPNMTTTASALTYTENDAATTIDPGLTLNDVDDAYITGATVSITAGFQSGADELGFTDQSGITGAYDTGSGVLTLTGSALVADYQSALESVTYQNTSEDPTETTRTMTFSVTDGNSDGTADGALSTTATRDITVTAVNDAPGLVSVQGFSVEQTSLGDAGDTFSDAGDIDNDGYDDVIVGSPGDDTNGTDAGSVQILSGNDGAILHTFHGDSAGDMFGSSVSDAGDTDGDGLWDFIVRAPGSDGGTGSAWLFHSQNVTTYANSTTIEVKSSGYYQGLLLGADTEGDTFGYSVNTNPGHGSLEMTDDGFKYINDGSPDDDSFAIDITDEHGLATMETFSIDVYS